MHVRELREEPGSQGEYPVGQLAEGLPTALHHRLEVIWWVRSRAEDPKLEYLKDDPQVNTRVTLKQQSLILPVTRLGAREAGGTNRLGGKWHRDPVMTTY